jgi:hypothetical protein
MEFRSSGSAADGGVDVPVGAGDEDVLLGAFHAKHAADDLRDLLRGLAAAEDHFRVALPQRAMVVNFGEAEVFEGHVAQTVEGLSGGQATSAELFQKAANVTFVHEGEILSSALIQIFRQRQKK